VSLAQSANASYSIRYSPLARSGALGFVAQNLAIARTDPADPDRNLQIYVGRALARFRERNGRDPANDVERAMAVVDWVATVMRHPAL
jgi:hypothetical protein